VNESFCVKSDMVSSIESTCRVCYLKYKFNDPRSVEATTLNKLSVLGSMSAGIGHNRLDFFTGVMSIWPPVATQAFLSIIKSRYGIYTLISLDTGKVIDVVLLSKLCPSSAFNNNKYKVLIVYRVIILWKNI